MKKRTKVLLGVLIALLVVLLAGGAILWQMNYFAKPVAPDNFWTLRNLTVDTGEDEITLAPEARLRAVKGEDEIALEFEVGLNDRILMPVRGEISEEGVSFALGSSGRIYTADMETLGELLGFEEGDAALLEDLKGVFQSYAALIEKSTDSKFIKQNSEAYSKMYEIMLSTTAEDVKVEVEGKEYSGKRYAGRMTNESLGALLDYMQNCEIEELQNVVRGLLDFASLLSNAEYESYSDLLAEAGDLFDADVELLVVQSGKISYQKLAMQQAGTDDMNIQSTMESCTTAKGTNMVMTQTMGDPQTNGTVQTMTLDLTGPVNAPTAFHFDMDYDSATDTSWDDYQYIVSMDMTIDLDGAQTDGLWNVTADADVAQDYTLIWDGETDSYNSAITVDASYAEANEADGSVTGAFAFTLGSGEEDYGVSFELNRGKDAVIEDLAGEDGETVALSADTTDASYTQLAADALVFVADAAELTADESVAALMEMFAPSYDESDLLDEEFYNDEEFYDEEIQQAASFEEAAAIYASSIPAYTAPEGYELSVINVTSTDMEAIFTGDEHEFSIYLLDFGADMELEPEFTYGDDGEGNIYYAEVMLGSAYVMFQFEDGVTQAEAEAITAGLELEM